MNNLLIYNPISGVDRDRDSQLGRIVRELTANGVEVTVYQTRYKGDAEEYFSKNDIGRFDKVICCGGDGTLHEIVNGMMGVGAKIPLGYIPQGTTNDYAKNLGITKSTAIKSINQGKTKCIDIGRFNGEYFNYVAAFGAFTNVSFATPQKFKNIFGYCAYMMGGIKAISNIASKHIVCQFGEQIIEDDILIGMITNAFSVAGISGLKQNAPELDDGLMEYLFIKMPRNIMDVQSTITLLLNGKVDEKYMYVGKAKHLNIYSELMEWTLDGENGGNFDEVQIDIIDKALTMIVGGE